MEEAGRETYVLQSVGMDTRMDQNSEIYFTRIREKINDMWNKRPEEVSKLKRTAGALDNKGALLMYIEAESRCLVQDLFLLKQTAKGGSRDF